MSAFMKFMKLIHDIHSSWHQLGQLPFHSNGLCLCNDLMIHHVWKSRFPCFLTELILCFHIFSWCDAACMPWWSWNPHATWAKAMQLAVGKKAHTSWFIIVLTNVHGILPVAICPLNMDGHGDEDSNANAGADLADGDADMYGLDGDVLEEKEEHTYRHTQSSHCISKHSWLACQRHTFQRHTFLTCPITHYRYWLA